MIAENTSKLSGGKYPKSRYEEPLMQVQKRITETRSGAEIANDIIHRLAG